MLGWTSTTTFEKAKTSAELLTQDSEDEWTYHAVDIGNGRGRIDVYDDEGNLMCEGL